MRGRSLAASLTTVDVDALLKLALEAEGRLVWLIGVGRRALGRKRGHGARPHRRLEPGMQIYHRLELHWG